MHKLILAYRGVSFTIFYNFSLVSAHGKYIQTYPLSFISFSYNLEFIKDFHCNKNYLYLCMFVSMDVDVHCGGVFSSNSNFQVFLRVKIPDIIFFCQYACKTYTWLD